MRASLRPPADRFARRRSRAVSAGVLAVALVAAPLAAGCSGDDANATGGPSASAAPTVGSDGSSSAPTGSPSSAVSSDSPTSPATSPATTGAGTAPSTVVATGPASPTLPSAPPTGAPAATPTAPAPAPPTGSAGAPGTVPPDGEGATLVASYGTGGTSALGILGRGTPQQAWDAVAKRAKAYDRPGLPAKPVFELIVTVAAADPGRGGKYRNRIDDAVIGQYVEAARANGGTIFLDIQPGRADFLTESKALQKWLELPNVGLALDPEWRMGPGQVPGRTIGSVQASEINEVSAWLDQLVVAKKLPDKLFVVHQFTGSMIKGVDQLADRPHLREVINVDGFGTRSVKLPKFKAFAAASPWPVGLKLFTKKSNDPDLLQPAEVLALKPRPVLVNYQ